jgi:hypothetical protein
MGTTATNQNLIRDELKWLIFLAILATVESRNFFLLVCCKNVKLRIYKTVNIYTLFCMGANLVPDIVEVT